MQASNFKVRAKNLPDETDVKTLYHLFKQYGEVESVSRHITYLADLADLNADPFYWLSSVCTQVLQCHLDLDDKEPYFIVQYIALASAQEAVRKANRMRLDNCIIRVEPYARKGTPACVNPPPPPPPPQPVQVQAQTQSRGSAVTPTPVAAAIPVSLVVPSPPKSLSPLLDMFCRRVTPVAAPAPRVCVVPIPQPLSSAPPVTSPAAPAPSPIAPATPIKPSLRMAMAAMTQHMGSLADLLCCPITQEVLCQPVVAADGNTYERLAIEAWLQRSDTSPLTNEPLSHKGLVPNMLVKAIIDEYL